jgi:hypothetical protein
LWQTKMTLATGHSCTHRAAAVDKHTTRADVPSTLHESVIISQYRRRSGCMHLPLMCMMRVARLHATAWRVKASEQYENTSTSAQWQRAGKCGTHSKPNSCIRLHQKESVLEGKTTSWCKQKQCSHAMPRVAQPEVLGWVGRRLRAACHCHVRRCCSDGS